MGSHQSSRGMNLENGWLYLTQHFHSISSDNINIIIRKPLICCKASTQHIPVQHWWLMKVSALKTISMNKEDKESVHNILWMCEKWYHYCEPCMCSHPLTLHISATFFAKQSGREIIFLSPLPDQCPCCHDKRRKWDKFTDQAKGQISPLKIFIQS